MASRIGSDLRRARTRREIELSEVEAATRIRARFLAAIENEEWDALPGGVYTRGFIRTYASYLGMDGERIVDDYRREVEGAASGPATHAPPGAGDPVSRRDGGRRVGWIAVGAVALAAGVAIFALPQGDGEEAAGPAPAPRPSHDDASTPAPVTPVERERASVSMRLLADAEVWVCALDDADRRLVDGQILQAGAEAGPFRSGSFTVSFGNGEVTMTIDGQPAQIPPSPSPIGYAIDAEGALTQLSESERPTCE